MNFKDRGSEKVRNVRTLIIGTGIIVLIVAGLYEEVFAPMRGVPPATSPKGTPIHPVVPPPKFF